ncbi:MAG: UvrD-helicase domain-containing protein [Ktedonobacteraceae bacterium]
MKSQWNVTFKPALLHDVLVLPPKETHQVMAKIDQLTLDPTPDAKVKKLLKYMSGDGKRLYRLRSGDYRIFYTFSPEKYSISLLAIRRRTDDTYDDDLDTELLEGLEVELDAMQPMHTPQPAWSKPLEDKRPFPEPLTLELLTTLAVPATYHARLLPITNEADLLACPGVEDEVLLEIDAYMFERPLSQVIQQPDLVLNDVDDLLRYREGELLAFLLKLSPEQQKYTRWSVDASGPTLVKGGPGTGKSTVALYRVRSLLEGLLKTGKGTPRILFTTYTNALVKASEQQLKQLLGTQAQYVQVNTADKLAHTILQEGHALREVIDETELRQITRQAIAETTFPGNMLQQQVQRQTLARMGLDYLLQELNSVIVARQIDGFETYKSTPRAGRTLRLNATQRQAIWLVYERWCKLLLVSGKETWQQRRARAATLVEKNAARYQAYDAVVIDEAQDLDPSALRMLIKLCKASNRLFITADANQSIYGSGFTWQDIHADLKFQGRTSILHANYRSTAEIGEAAQSYLTSGTLEPEVRTPAYSNDGPLPDARSVNAYQHEIQLLASFFHKASRSLRLTLGSCAVLCPNKNIGQAIANDLSQAGLEATYMEGRDLNLARPGIKLMTLSASKGLEFPIVALAGFLTSTYPVFPKGASDEEKTELLARERRTMFVGMTRAMRALLVVVPANPSSTLLEGFDPTYWNFNRNI